MEGPKEVVIGEDTYMITLFPAGKGLNILKQLSKLLGDSFASILVRGEDAQVDEGILGEAIGKLVHNMDAVDMEKLARSMLEEHVLVNGKKIGFNTHFAGNYGCMINLLKEVAVFNYQNFFSDLMSLRDDQKPDVAAVK